MLSVAIWYVSIRPVVMQSSSSFTLITTVRIETYQIATYNIRTLLKMDYWSPKHVELLNVMNKTNHQILCILLDYRYSAIWYTVHIISHYRSNTVAIDIFSKQLSQYGASWKSPFLDDNHTPQKTTLFINICQYGMLLKSYKNFLIFLSTILNVHFKSQSMIRKQSRVLWKEKVG